MIETEQVLIVRRRGIRRVWCAACEAEVELVTVEEAAVITRVGVRAIYCWVETGQLHFIETSTGELFICSNSLLHDFD